VSDFLLLSARGLLALHVLFVGFIVLGLAALLTGTLLRWKWAKSPRLRHAHLAAIAFVVLRSWFALPCPLTTAELWLRDRAAAAAEAGESARASVFDRAAWALVLRGADPERFRTEATAWAAATCVVLLAQRVSAAREEKRHPT
jgi:Protein of Unknown function (DUF2784)